MRYIKVKSLKRGKNISKPEVVSVSEHGFWFFWREQEYFLPFDDFPWFKDATISQISNIEISGGTHLYWPALDVDLSLSIIKAPEKYRLISK